MMSFDPEGVVEAIEALRREVANLSATVHDLRRDLDHVEYVMIPDVQRDVENAGRS